MQRYLNAPTSSNFEMPEGATQVLTQTARLLVDEIKESALITTGSGGGHGIEQGVEIRE